jgi:hypothetical protein
MNFSKRFVGPSALFLAVALVACGSMNAPADNGSTGGGSGTGGAGSGGAGGAVSDASDTTDMSNDTDLPDGSRDAQAGTDASVPDVRADVATPRPDVADSTTPPSDAAIPPSDSSNPEDLIREMLARFDVVELEARYRELEAKSLPDRYTKSANYTAITEWIRDMMNAEGTGLEVRFDEWEGYRNIEIAIKGTDPAAGMYILGGHLDSVKNTVAMDDNGSGGLGMALMARALSHYRYKAEIRCVIFDAEEIGLVGSAHYAQALKASGCDANTCLKAYINLDEVAYDPQSRRGMRVWSDVAALQMMHTQVNNTYGLGLTLTLASGSCHRSDDCSFSDQGYPTVYNFQAAQSPYYHMPGDTSDTLNFTTLTKVLQIAAGVVATGAVPVGRFP